MDDKNIFENDSWKQPEYNYPFDTPIVKEAKSVFSRYNLGLFVYTAAAYAVIFLVNIILSLVLSPEDAIKLSESVWYQWLMGVGPMYVIGFPIFFFIVKDMPKNKRLKKKIGGTEFCALFLVAEAFMFVGNIIGTSLNGVIGAIMGREIENGTSELIEKSPVWLIFLIVVIVGPIIEELLFRKLMIDRFSKYGDMLAIIFSAVAFGLFHGNFYQFFYAAFLGLLLGYVYTKSGDVRYTITMHMIINFIGSVAVIPIINAQDIMLSLSEITDFTELESIIAGNIRELAVAFMALYSYTIIQYTMVVSGLIIFYRAIKYRMIKVNKYPKVKIPKGRTAEAVLLNVGTMLFLAMSLVIFGLNLFLA